MNENKRFGDWKEEVPCDNCEMYYTGECDSIKSECRDYRPTRHARLDAKITRLERSVNVVRNALIMTDVLIAGWLLIKLVKGV